MKTTSIFLLSALISLFLFSCTVQKRMFNKGYHIEWNRKIQCEKSSESKRLVQKIADNDALESGEEVYLSEGNDSEKEKQLIIDTVDSNNSITSGDEDSESKTDLLSSSEKEQGKRIKETVSGKKTNISHKSNHYVAYGGGGGRVMVVFVILVLFLFGLLYLAVSSASYAALILLLAFAGWALVAVFVILLIILFVRLFFGAYR